MEDLTRELWESIVRAHSEMEKLFREMIESFSKYGVYFGVQEPPVDIEDRGDELVIYADLPGFSKDEIRIKVTEDSVEIRAEKSEERKAVEREKKYIVRQRIWEKFYKRIELPEKVRPELAKAKLENGVLELHLPKSEARREVEITVE